MNHRPWTDAEDNVVIAAYANTRRLKEVAVELNRSRNAVISRANRLGLGSHANYDRVIRTDWFQALAKQNTGGGPKPTLDHALICKLAPISRSYEHIMKHTGGTVAGVAKVIYQNDKLLFQQWKVLVKLHSSCFFYLLSREQLEISPGWMRRLITKGYVTEHSAPGKVTGYRLTEAGLDWLKRNELIYDSATLETQAPATALRRKE
jgi:hypothetical protein